MPWECQEQQFASRYLPDEDVVSFHVVGNDMAEVVEEVAKAMGGTRKAEDLHKYEMQLLDLGIQRILLM